MKPFEFIQLGCAGLTNPSAALRALPDALHLDAARALRSSAVGSRLACDLKTRTASMAAPDSPLLRFRLWRAALPPALRLLMTINVAAFVAWVVLMLFAPLTGLLLQFLSDHLLLNPILPDLFLEPWQLLTYAFLNPAGDFFGFIGFVFAMLWLYWMGREYEEVYGSHRLLGLYLLSAIGGALVAAALPFWSGPVVFGAFGPALAVLCCVAVLHPNRGMGLLFLGVVPLKWVAIGFSVLDIAFAGPFRAAHLGAILTGTLFGYAQKHTVDLAVWARPFFARDRGTSRSTFSAAESGRGRHLRRVVKRDEPSLRRRPSRRATPEGPADVDEILDKILEKGFDSLTAEEKRVLDEASRR